MLKDIKLGISNELKKKKNDDIINSNDFDINNILLNEKSYEIFFIVDVAHKTLYVIRPLCIIFDKANAYIRKYDRTKYLA